MPTIPTGCTILRDAKGNPGRRIEHRREASEAELDAYCRFLLEVAGKLAKAERRACAAAPSQENRAAG